MESCLVWSGLAITRLCMLLLCSYLGPGNKANQEGDGWGGQPRGVIKPSPKGRSVQPARVRGRRALSFTLPGERGRGTSQTMPRTGTGMGRRSLKESESSEEEMEGVFWDARGNFGQLKASGPSQHSGDIEGLRVRKTSRPVRSKARRIAANVRERKRILDYNQAFNALRLALKHDLSGKRLSKIATLRRAIHRITSLSTFLRSGSAARWPCSHQECQTHYGRVREEEAGWEGPPQPFQMPLDYSYGEAALPFQMHPPSPLYLKYSPEFSSQLDSQKEESIPPNPAFHSSGSCPLGEQPPCYPKFVDNLCAPSPRTIPWQLGYLRGPGPGYQQSLPMH